MAEVVYMYGGKPYLNITNQCPCACVFCIRAQAGGLGSAQSLWHAEDPSWEEIRQALEQNRALFADAEEAVFCGYGEPFCALEQLRRSAGWLRAQFPALRLRVNTNGLGDLISGRDAAQELAGLADTISISLNAPTAARYCALVQPCFGEAAFAAVLAFADRCKALFPQVIFTVVDVLSQEETQACQRLADAMGIPLRVRNMV